jgi:hypothetical protein
MSGTCYQFRRSVSLLLRSCGTAMVRFTNGCSREPSKWHACDQAKRRSGELVRGSPATHPAFIDSPRVTLAVLGFFAFSSTAPALQGLITTSANVSIGDFTMIEEQFINQYINFLFPVAFLTLVVLVATTMSLPPSSRLAALRSGLQGLRDEVKVAREDILKVNTKRRWPRAWLGVATFALATSYLLQQLGPQFCGPNGNGTIAVHDHVFTPQHTAPFVMSGLVTVSAISLATSFGVLMWFGHTRPTELMTCCQGRCSALTSQLQDGLQGISESLQPGDNSQWEQYVVHCRL